MIDPAALLGRVSVSADWDTERPLDAAALAAYAEHGVLHLRGFAPPALLQAFRDEVATMIGLVLGELGLDPRASVVDRFDRGLDLLLAADRPRVGRLYVAVRKLPSVYALVTAPRVGVSKVLVGLNPGRARAILAQAGLLDRPSLRFFFP